MVFIGKLVILLILVGVLNGLIFLIILGIMFIVFKRKDIVGDYKYFIWFLIFGLIVVLIFVYIGIIFFSSLGVLFV